MNNVREMKWGNSSPIIYVDPKYGQLELMFDGVCSYSINSDNLDATQVEGQLFQNIMQCIVNIVSSFSGFDYNEVEKKVNENLLNQIQSNYNGSNIVINNIGFVMKLSDNSLTIVSNKTKEQVVSDSNGPVIVKTDDGAKDGQNKCPSCGSTEISLNVNTGKLRCHYCRCEFEPEKVDGLDGDIRQLRGQVMGSGATDIIADTNDVVTFKCSSCGAEVVVDTATSAQARCHWCRSTLSVNQQIPNGSIPDVVLPFVIKKEDAKVEIEKFVNKRKFFAHPKFRAEFTTDNIMGVYFPYMLVDVNSHATFEGQGEKLIRRYTVGSGDNRETRYDADLYDIVRDFDLTIDDLTIESSSDRLNNSQSAKTNNVINAIMPFDTENCVKWNANYIKGYTSEKRDTNVDQLKNIVELQSRDVARFAINKTLSEYDRGVAWSKEEFTVKGQQWKAAYLPVWLYSYQQKKGDKSILHYVAVNARSKETMGSVPINVGKLLFFSFLIEILGVLGMLFVEDDIRYAFLLLGFIFFGIMYLRYRNSNARHKHETETKYNMSSVVGNDVFVEHRRGLKNSMMRGYNNKNVTGKTNKGNVLGAMDADNVNKVISNTVVNNNVVADIVENNLNNNKSN